MIESQSVATSARWDFLLCLTCVISNKPSKLSNFQRSCFPHSQLTVTSDGTGKWSHRAQRLVHDGILRKRRRSFIYCKCNSLLCLSFINDKVRRRKQKTKSEISQLEKPYIGKQTFLNASNPTDDSAYIPTNSFKLQTLKTIFSIL